MKLISFDDIIFESYGLAPYTPPSIKNIARTANYVSRGSRSSVYAGLQLSSQVIPWYIEFPGTGSLDTWRIVLERLLRWDLDSERELIREDDAGNRQVILARPRDFQWRVGRVYDLTFEASEAEWQSLSVDVQSVSETGPAIAGDPITLDVLTSGTARTRPVITAQILLAKPDDLTIYTERFTVTAPASHGWVDHPYTFEIDHAARVTALKSTAAGADILVRLSGEDLPRSIANPNTATTTITVPLTLGAGESATLEVSFAPEGQTYPGTITWKAAVNWTLTNQIAAPLTDVPCFVDFDHASYVTAGRSNADGSDIRVFVNGIERDRALSGVNTATCHVAFPLTAAASALAFIEIRLGGASFAGTTYTNGSQSLAASTISTWIYPTPDVDTTTLNTPGLLKAELRQVNAAWPVATAYSTDNNTAPVTGEPSLRTLIRATGPTTNGNYVRWYAGGLRIASLHTAVRTQSSGLDGIARIADSTDGTTYTSRHTFAKTSAVETAVAYASYALSSTATYVIAGMERDDTTLQDNDNVYAHWYGTGSDELKITIHPDDVPSLSATSDPLPVTTGAEFITATISVDISDQLRHYMRVRGLRLLSIQKLKIDTENRRIVVLDENDEEVAGSAASSCRYLTVDSPDLDWLALEPNTTTTITWDDAGLAANGITVTVEATDRWH